MRCVRCSQDVVGDNVFCAECVLKPDWYVDFEDDSEEDAE
jgi:hypothetical protein